MNRPSRPTLRVPSQHRSGASRPLRAPFFARATEVVARELLGAVFWVRSDGGVRSVRLVETEAYVADDPANHANRGITRRNRSMFGAPGTIYVYRVHQVVCANVVTRPGQAVLLRAAEPLRGPLAGSSTGPGRFCRALGITIQDDGQDGIAGGRFGFRRGTSPVGTVAVGPRIGISRARERPLRFAVVGSSFVTRPWPKSLRRLSGASPSRSRGGARYRRSRRTRRLPAADDRSGVRSAGR